MLKKNVDIILKQIGPNDKVLDIGGWIAPFNRANYVIDIMPHETRGIFGHSGPEKEFFTRDRWIIHDVSSVKPLPFNDKEIDYVVCSHLLEDIRDPIRLCSEIIRVGKRGYVEVPSRTIESTMGAESKENFYAGYYHHRWLIEIANSEIVFRHKSHLLHSSSRFHLPKKYLKKMKEEDKVSYMFWEGFFEYKEIIQVSYCKVMEELENFARSKITPSYFKAKVRKLREMLKFIRNRIRIRNRSIESCSDFWKKIPDIESK